MRSPSLPRFRSQRVVIYNWIMENCKLPEQVVFSILLWLPVISLIRFRSVCKTWCSLIDSSFFINQHFLHQDDIDSDGKLILSSMEVCDWFLLSGHQFEQRTNLDYYDVFDNNFPRMAPPCNGIICLSGQYLKPRLGVALWNPATKELLRLPEPPPLPELLVVIHVALGYVVKANDYKVVRFITFISSDNMPGYSRAEVYSLQTNSWKNVDSELPAGNGILSNQTSYLNGHSYWFICLLEGNNPSVKIGILSFDFSDEMFEIMELPNGLSIEICNPHLAILGDSVAFIAGMKLSCSDDGHFDIWVLSKYGVKESWTKLYTIRPIQAFAHVKLHGLSKNGKFLLLTRIHSGLQLLLSDRNNQEEKNLHIVFFDIAVYKESLVSVKKMMHEREQR